MDKSESIAVIRPSEKLEILYQDEFYLAVNKPSGLLVHRSPISRSEKRFALQIVRNQVGCHVFPVHRLDRPTSGVLLFALSSEAAKRAARLFQSNLIKKTYMAVVRGYIQESGTIDYPLRSLDAHSQSAPHLPAVTCYRRMARIELPYAVDRYPTARYSLVAPFPLSGRRHQLRRHMKHISHPIIGDTRYGKSTHNHFFKNHFKVNRLLLAATMLRFTHPYTREEIKIEAKPGTCFEYVMSRLFGSPE